GVVVGVVGACALEDLEVHLLPDFGLHSGGVFPGGSAHPALLGALSHAPGAQLGPRARLPLMRVLAVETSTLAGGAALLDGDLVVGEYTLQLSPAAAPRRTGS